jgi:hypothetical protein
MNASNVGSNVVSTGWNVTISKNSNLNISQKNVIVSQIYTSFVVDFLKDQPPEVVIITSDLLEIDQNKPKPELCDFYDPVFILEKLGIPGKDPEFDFENQILTYTIENNQQHLTFEQLYDILINNYKETLTEKITTIDKKVENLKINIETSVSNFAQNRIDISAYIENSDINLVQSNEVYTKMFDELKELSQKVKLIPETKGSSDISNKTEQTSSSIDKPDSDISNISNSGDIPTIEYKEVKASDNDENWFKRNVFTITLIIIIFLFVIFFVYCYKYISKNGIELEKVVGGIFLFDW